MSLEGTKTHENLKEAFAGESQANRRYLWFAQKADVEGYPDTSALFRSVAEGETGHAFGHFDFLAEVGDPATGEPVGPTEDNLKSAIAGETYELLGVSKPYVRLPVASGRNLALLVPTFIVFFGYRRAKEMRSQVEEFELPATAVVK